MTESVYKVIELIGTSKESWEKAATAAVNRAGKSLRDLRVAEVVQLDLQLDAKGKVEAYRAKLKVSFKFEGWRSIGARARIAAFSSPTAWGRWSRKLGSAVLKTMIAPSASAIKRSIFESKAMSAKRRLVISADRTTIAFAELLEKEWRGFTPPPGWI
jgi:dodecin